MASPPSFSPDTVNQTVENDGATWKGQPGGNWTLQSGGGGGGMNFDFEAETLAAFEKLRPYYEKILGLAKGDVALAKRIIEFDYTQGTRESKGEFEQRSREQALLFPSEQGQLIAGLGQRGLVGGTTEKELRAGTGAGLAGTKAGQLKESQTTREEAIKRALDDREARLIKDKEFKTEDVERGFETKEQQLSRQHEQEAGQMAGIKFGRETTLEQMQRQADATAEASRINQELRDFNSQPITISSGGGGGGGGSHINPVTKVWDDNYYANVGRFLG